VEGLIVAGHASPSASSCVAGEAFPNSIFCVELDESLPACRASGKNILKQRLGWRLEVEHFPGRDL